MTQGETAAAAPRVLVVDDDVAMTQLVAAVLKKRGWASVTLRSGDEAAQWLAQNDCDAIVTDLNMPGLNGVALCERAVANRPDVPVIVMTAFGRLDTAIAAIRAGAYDFLPKPFDMDALILAVDRALKLRALREEVKRLRASVADRDALGELIGASAAMQRVYAVVDRLAESDAPLLITGESGTGKEVLARTIHQRSRRAQGPFVVVHCASVPEALMESEFFGHVQGAFPDARSDRRGLFAQADGGTILLDEVGEMPLAIQAKILRAVQDRVARPLGSDVDRPFDVRIMASTHRDIEALVEEKKFREDLYYRLNVIQVAMPPLRSREGDVLLLAQRFIERLCRAAGKPPLALSPEAASKLRDYGWPGNVRELQNCLERAVALCAFDRIVPDDLPEKIRAWRSTHVVIASADPTELIPLDEVERRYILRVLEAVNGNKTVAAQVLRVDRTTLYRKLERWGVKE